MRWKGRRQSANIEDRRSMRGPVVAGGGLLGLILVLVVILLGGDPRPLLQQMQNAPPGGPQGQVAVDPEEEELAQFVRVVLADTEDVWTEQFRMMGQAYRTPTLVMFRDRVQSACGFQGAATGPFYCPLDEKVYIDLGFYDDMERQLGAPGDFAQAYVIAHEIGHHVQKLLGISDRVQQAQARGSQEAANELSVRLELQADFLAGVWGHHAEKNWRILEDGDIEEALNAASAIGDDRLQRRQQGYVVPESFTHGSSQQRVAWFMRGLRSGDMEEGDTFGMAFDEL